MGHYVRKKKERQRSISETLSEAEDEHYLDCPDADLITRCAAGLLDGILIFLAVTAIDRMSKAMGVILSGNSAWSQLEATIRVGSLACKIMAFYLIDILATCRWGGSFGKVLLGLRVIDRQTGSNLSFSQAMTRELVGKILLGALSGGIGWALASFRTDRLTLQDLVGGSVVKKVRQKV